MNSLNEKVKQLKLHCKKQSCDFTPKIAATKLAPKLVYGNVKIN